MAWSGLGITASQPYGSWFEFNASTHAAISAPFLPSLTKFPRIRIIADRASANSQAAQHLWALDIKGYSPSTFIHYGIANNGVTGVYLPTFYATYLPIMLAEAQWAQDNLMDEFQVGNEFEIGNESGTTNVTSLTRSSNVVTLVINSGHGLQTGDTIVITGASPSNYNTSSDTACTVVDANTLTYASTGTDGTATGTIHLQAGAQTIVRFVKLLAAAAQAVFTRGDITYSVSQGHESAWTSITPGVDLDTLGLDEYAENSYDNFVTNVTNFHTTFGDQMYLSEFNLHSNWASVSINGATPAMRDFDNIYADEVSKRLQFIKSLGIKQAYFYQAWQDDNEFSAFYNTNRLHGNFAGGFFGGWKSVYDALLEQRKTHTFIGAQDLSSGSPVLQKGQPISTGELARLKTDFGTALDFRSGGKVAFGTSNPFGNPNGFYVSAWVKWFGGNGAFQHILAKRDTYGATTMMFDLFLDSVTNDVSLDTGAGAKDFATVLPINRWVHLCYVHIGNPLLQEQLYLDCDRVSSQSITGQGTGTGALLTIGAAEAGAVEPFNGFIDEVVIGDIDQISTTAEDPTWRNVIAMGKKSSYRNVSCYFKFDEGSGTTATDSSGKGNTGTITTASYIRDLTLRS